MKYYSYDPMKYLNEAWVDSFAIFYFFLSKIISLPTELAVNYKLITILNYQQEQIINNYKILSITNHYKLHIVKNYK